MVDDAATTCSLPLVFFKEFFHYFFEIIPFFFNFLQLHNLKNSWMNVSFNLLSIFDKIQKRGWKRKYYIRYTYTTDRSSMWMQSETWNIKVRISMKTIRNSQYQCHASVSPISVLYIISFVHSSLLFIRLWLLLFEVSVNPIFVYKLDAENTIN